MELSAESQYCCSSTSSAAACVGVVTQSIESCAYLEAHGGAGVDVVNLHPRRTTPGQTIGLWHDAIFKSCCTQPRLYILCDEMQGISSDASALPLRQDCRLPGRNHCRGHCAALMLCQRLELPTQPCRASPRKDVSMCQGLHCATVFRAQYKPKPFRQINLEQLRRNFAQACGTTPRKLRSNMPSSDEGLLTRSPPV